MNKLLLALSLLCSCAPALQSPATTIHGVPVRYQVTEALPGGTNASAQWLSGHCLIRVRPGAVTSLILAHELGHCLDAGHSRRFGQAGCVWREYACDPAEGYADTYARLYFERFGFRLDVLRWPGQPGASEQPPLPDEVFPEMVRELQSRLAAQH
ncbi:hypothetical protein ACINK0_17715 (plasmid) [Deinococcus sp. VB343]|uniref:Uncharacterized protein n=1 Tax=Deinococcus sp. VB142 TaxID=3112952 RepID=A0AAU6Q968_9DEIO